jgi:hypothetical protein
MTLTNEISVTINDEAMAKIKEGLNLIYANLPKLFTLTNDQRHALPKMGDKTLAFVTKSIEYAKQNPDIVPKYLDMAEFDKDVKAVTRLFEVAAPLHKLLEELDDTMLMAGSEAYIASLAFYSALKTAIKSGQTGLKNIYDDLSTRFPGRPSQKADKKNP